MFQVNNHNVQWAEFLSHWPLWSVYIAHFSMNWSNYIIMQWLPTYMARNLGAEKHDIMFTAVPYLLNSLIGVGKWKLIYSTSYHFLRINAIVVNIFGTKYLFVISVHC